MYNQPIVIISSYPPRLCGIATFAEEAREFIKKANPDKEVLVISHTDGEGEGVFPLIEINRYDWYEPVADKINELKPYAIRLACDEDLRMTLGENLKKYLDEVVSWEIIADKYNQAYHLARNAKISGKLVIIEPEF